MSDDSDARRNAVRPSRFQHALSARPDPAVGRESSELGTASVRSGMRHACWRMRERRPRGAFRFYQRGLRGARASGRGTKALGLPSRGAKVLAPPLGRSPPPNGLPNAGRSAWNPSGRPRNSPPPPSGRLRNSPPPPSGRPRNSPSGRPRNSPPPSGRQRNSPRGAPPPKPLSCGAKRGCSRLRSLKPLLLA